MFGQKRKMFFLKIRYNLYSNFLILRIKPAQMLCFRFTYYNALIPLGLQGMLVSSHSKFSSHYTRKSLWLMLKNLFLKAKGWSSDTDVKVCLCRSRQGPTKPEVLLIQWPGKRSSRRVQRHNSFSPNSPQFNVCGPGNAALSFFVFRIDSICIFTLI